MNILKDSNYCLDSLAIRLRSKDLKTPYPKKRTTRNTGLACIMIPDSRMLDSWAWCGFFMETNDNSGHGSRLVNCT